MDEQHLPRFVFDNAARVQTGGTKKDAQPSHRRRPLAVAEVEAIWTTLARNDGHRGRTASELDISASTAWRKMECCDISL